MRLIRPVQRLGLGVLAAWLGLCAAGAAQPQDEQRRTKVPLIGKVGGGSNRLAFSGKVKSVDPKRKLLVVDAVEGSYTEYFKVKGNFEVTAPGGKNIRVSELQPGTTVIVYYDVKNDRRSVTNILVLGAQNPEKEEESKKPPSPS